MSFLQGILDAYQYTLGVAELYGPTNFSLILDKAMSYASNSVTQKQQSYHILLIITVRHVVQQFNSMCRLSYNYCI